MQGNRDRRPRLRDSRAEEVLNAVEHGSFEQVVSLASGQWSQNPKDLPIILRTIFNILQDEITPTRPTSIRTQEGDNLSSAVEASRPLKRVIWLVRVLWKAITYEVEAQETCSKSVFSDVFELYLDVLARWFEFYMRSGSWTYILNPHQSGDAPAFIAEYLCSLYLAGTDKLQSRMHATDSITNLVLELWMSRDEEGVCHEKSASVKITQDCPFVLLLRYFCLDPTSKPIIATKIACFTQAKQRQFIANAIQRIEWWKKRQLQKHDILPAVHLTQIVVAISDLLDSAGHQYHKAYFKEQFPSHVLALSQQFGQIKSNGKPLHVQIASMFLIVTSRNPVDVQRRLVLELLNKGLVKSIIFDMLSKQHDTPAQWSHWSTPRPEQEAQNPLVLLAELAIDQGVCMAISSAIEAVPENDLKRLRSSWAEKYWAPFVETIQLYKKVWKYDVPEDGAAMCDSALHDHNNIVVKGETKKCAGCCTRVYCSPLCQKMDWEAMHKNECHIARAARIVASGSI
ncbi:hypothetical protein NMY22_g12272 [Coprinellus aureogranulatus]|nr:hypothetical protein NMY22_g12272 [Coprinellus aureogranulatus]